MLDHTKKDDVHDYIIRRLLRGDKWIYLALRALQEATEFPRKIPFSHYTKYDDCSYTEYFEIGKTKEDARIARLQIIEVITFAIKSHKIEDGEKMLHDHYARLFHALAILKLDKGTDMLPGTLKDNYIYNAMYTLWRADDGSDEIGDAIMRSAWFAAEDYKGLIGQNKSDCIVGMKC